MAEPKRKRVLIVEDSDSLQLMMKWGVSNAGYDVDLASDGKQAIQMVQSSVPDLILLDVMMPGLNGFAVCRQLRENERTKHTPIIIITALTAALDSEEAKLCGANEVIVKPLSREDLVKKVRAYLGSVFG